MEGQDTHGDSAQGDSYDPQTYHYTIQGDGSEGGSSEPSIGPPKPAHAHQSFIASSGGAIRTRRPPGTPAPAGSLPKDRGVPCKFYAEGICEHGDNCSFSQYVFVSFEAFVNLFIFS